MDIGKKIKYLRMEKGLSVEELAKRIGKNKATVYRYEKGDIDNLPYTVLIPIAEALGVLPTYFFDCADSTDIQSILDNPNFQETLRKWIASVGTVEFSDEEFNDLVDYAKFILSKRK